MVFVVVRLFVLHNRGLETLRDKDRLAQEDTRLRETDFVLLLTIRPSGVSSRIFLSRERSLAWRNFRWIIAAARVSSPMSYLMSESGGTIPFSLEAIGPAVVLSRALKTSQVRRGTAAVSFSLTASFVSGSPPVFPS